MTDTSPARTTADRFFLRSLLITTLIRAVMAAIVPLTGDEAYFIVWGEHPDFGYYDHTPMVGWWLSAMLALGRSVWLMRLPALLTTVVVAWLIWRAAKSLDAGKAGWAGALYLWSPHNVLNFLITTDTPLVLFSALAGVALFRAVQRDRWPGFLLAGLLLGLAFLSKYFAVLLGAAFAVILLGFAGRPRWGALLLVLAGVMPSAALNIAWNHQHGWTNILFNLFNRTSDAGFAVGNVLAYLAVIILPVAPLAWGLLRRRVEGRLPWRDAWVGWRRSGAHVYVLAVAVPLALLLVVSLQKPVGAHWPLSFFPFLFIALVGLFSAERLQRMARAMRAFGAVLCACVIVLALIPLQWLSGHKSYDSIILGAHPGEVLAALEPYRGEYALTTLSYAKSAMLGFASGSHVPVIGTGSYHGRQDDLITDWSSYAGRNIMVLCDSDRRVATARAWFEASEVHDVFVRGARFQLVLGRSFKFAEYRQTVIGPIARRYYSMPGWLAEWAEPSFYFVRYRLPAADAVREPGM